MSDRWTDEAWNAALLLRADICCNNGCGCEEYDYCAVEEWDRALLRADLASVCVGGEKKEGGE